MFTFQSPSLSLQDDGPVGCCCGLTKEHLEAFIFWAITCWAGSRRKSGRADISYRKYKPLRADAAAMEEEEKLAEQRQLELQERQKEGGGGGESDWLATRTAADAAAAAAAATAGNSTKATTTRSKTAAAGKRTKPKVRSANNGGGEGGNRDSKAVSTQMNPLPARVKHSASSDGSSSSDDEEEELMLNTAPADKNIERGTWLMDSASKWYGFGR